MKRENRENNVYIDLGIKSPEEMHTKANIVASIILKMETKCLTAAEISAILQVDVSVLRAIISGQFHDISTNELKRIRDTI